MDMNVLPYFGAGDWIVLQALCGLISFVVCRAVQRGRP